MSGEAGEVATTEKLQELDTLSDILDEIRSSGKRIVVCHGVFDLLAVTDPVPATAFPLLGLGPLATFRFRPFPPFPLDRLSALGRLPFTNLDVTLTLTFLRRQRPSDRHQHRHCT